MRRFKNWISFLWSAPVRKWAAITAGAILTAIGILTGAITVKDRMDRKPNLAHKYTGFFTAGRFYNGKRESAIFLSLAIINDGAKPFYPESWKLRIKIDEDEWIECEPRPVPDTLNNHEGKPMMVFKGNDPRDLVFTQSIAPDERIDGTLMFGTEKVGLKFLQPVDLENNSVSYELRVTNLVDKREFTFSRETQPSEAITPGGFMIFLPTKQ